MIMPNADDTEEKMEQIYQCSLKIKDFDDDSRQTIAKIGRMCTETVQKEFLSLKDLAAWNPTVLWEHLKTQYTLQN